jgi:Flp pilus assembly protein TadG
MSRVERGAIAVEFAILLPVLLILLMGIIEFGLAFNTQITLTQAAREGARIMAINDDPAEARDTIRASTPTLNPQLADNQIEIVSVNLFDASSAKTMDACSPGNQVHVSIHTEFQPLTGFIGPISVSGRAAMRCGG